MRAISSQEAYRRYYAAKKEAESEVELHERALTTAADLVDRLEMVNLWRGFIAGVEVNDVTWDMMLEATNP